MCKMEFIADLHLHSHFSRATANNLDLEHISRAAMVKGISVVGTGDFTHPGWFKELEEKLEPAEDGLFRLKQEIERTLYGSGGSDSSGCSYIPDLRDNSLTPSGLLDGAVPSLCRGTVRFILQCEISSIYKKDGRVRKNHNLIYFSDMAAVKAFNEKLGRIGNITSDGRPILGLDCEKLLEIMLETSEDAFMIPAHIWTPWFSMFGSKSGFDSVEECFGPLSHHIFAVETGLSSDLPMNWRVENLDKMSFISCSDAHSPMFMGRNCSRFNTLLSYFGIRDALKQPSSAELSAQSFSAKLNGPAQVGYMGTIDMHPEEGKYHYDGHRKCNICFNPSETARHGGICPVCGKPLTLGVLYRVQQLASRPEGYMPENRHGYQTIIPLAEILSEICGTGTKTKKVELYYRRALENLGPELDILLKREIDEIERGGIPLLAEAIKRMRGGNICLKPGFDGEFGRVTLFNPDEIGRLKGDISIFPLPGAEKAQKRKEQATELSSIDRSHELSSIDRSDAEPSATGESCPVKSENTGVDLKIAGALNPEQQQAINSRNRPLLMEAGPGTGKTRTLTEKIVSLITVDHVNPSSIVALTFTTRAAEEMRQRIHKLMPDAVKRASEFTPQLLTDMSALSEKSAEYGRDLFASTFHGFCLMVLKEYSDYSFAIADETLRRALVEKAIKSLSSDSVRDLSSSKMELAISMAKQGAVSDPETHNITMQVLSKYQELLSSYQRIDFDDLIVMVLNLLESDSTILSALKHRFSHLFVDEYQDINSGQYKLIRLMAGDGKNLCVIGDPDQSIYGFRGADNSYFKRFELDYPDTKRIIFKRNYRSTETILEASFQLISSIEGKIGATGSSDLNKHISDNSSDADHTKERLFSGIKGEQQIHILEAASEEAQAVMIGKRIEQLVGGISMFSMDAGKADSALKDEYSFSDVAVLYRSKKQSAVISSVFEKAGIPFQTADRENIFLQRGIKELISSLRISINRGTFYDYDLLLSYLKSSVNRSARERLSIGKTLNSSTTGLPEKVMEFFNQLKGKKTADILRQVSDHLEIARLITESEKSMQSARLLMAEAEKYPDPEMFYENIAMKRDIDTLEYQVEKVSLMTMHASKGLEFKVIFIAGCENGLIPFYNSVGKCENIEEERRLLYVAMTRAQELLYLCHARKRQIYGKTVEMERSLFLHHIEESLKQYSRARLKSSKKGDCARQLELFGSS